MSFPQVGMRDLVCRKGLEAHCVEISGTSEACWEQNYQYNGYKQFYEDVSSYIKFIHGEKSWCGVFWNKILSFWNSPEQITKNKQTKKIPKTPNIPPPKSWILKSQARREMWKLLPVLIGSSIQYFPGEAFVQPFVFYCFFDSRPLSRVRLK